MIWSVALTSRGQVVHFKEMKRGGKSLRIHFARPPDRDQDVDEEGGGGAAQRAPPPQQEGAQGPSGTRPRPRILGGPRPTPPPPPPAPVPEKLRYCAVAGCPPSSKSDGLSYHKIPNEPLSLRMAWVQACGISNIEQRGQVVICSRHFKVTKYITIKSV